MKVKFLLILFFNISYLYGQENILTAKDAIIKVQKKISTYTNIKLSFDFTIAGDNEFTNSDFEGILYVEKKKYFLQIIFDQFYRLSCLVMTLLIYFV